jgi:hypothetical protein
MNALRFALVFVAIPIYLVAAGVGIWGVVLVLIQAFQLGFLWGMASIFAGPVTVLIGPLIVGLCTGQWLPAVLVYSSAVVTAPFVVAVNVLEAKREK